MRKCQNENSSIEALSLPEIGVDLILADIYEGVDLPPLDENGQPIVPD